MGVRDCCAGCGVKGVPGGVVVVGGGSSGGCGDAGAGTAGAVRGAGGSCCHAGGCGRSGSRGGRSGRMDVEGSLSTFYNPSRYGFQQIQNTKSQVKDSIKMEVPSQFIYWLPALDLSMCGTLNYNRRFVCREDCQIRPDCLMGPPVCLVDGTRRTLSLTSRAPKKTCCPFN